VESQRLERIRGGESRDSKQQGVILRLSMNALKFVCLKLAKDIVIDGEGAERFFEITVTGAKNETSRREKLR